MAYRNSSLDMPGRIVHMRDPGSSEPGPGVLAYADGQGGRLGFGRAEDHLPRPGPLTDDPASRGPERVVGGLLRGAAGFRRRGLMHHLLEGAVGHARAMGAAVLEGYPVDPGGEGIDQTSGYVCTIQLFEAHGFRRVQQTAGRRGGSPRWLVRRSFPDLAPSFLFNYAAAPRPMRITLSESPDHRLRAQCRRSAWSSP
jgi:GNAT superfamily N-acetyltransferase